VRGRVRCSGRRRLRVSSWQPRPLARQRNPPTSHVVDLDRPRQRGTQHARPGVRSPLRQATGLLGSRFALSAGLAWSVQLAAVLAANVGAAQTAAGQGYGERDRVAHRLSNGNSVPPVLPVAGDAVRQLSWAAVLELRSDRRQHAPGAVFGNAPRELDRQCPVDLAGRAARVVAASASVVPLRGVFDFPASAVARAGALWRACSPTARSSGASSTGVSLDGDSCGVPELARGARRFLLW
jgi:hypothetical protein